MQEMQTPRLNPAKDGLLRRKLDMEFEKSPILKVPEPEVDINNPYGGCGAGAVDSSRIETYRYRPCLDVGMGARGSEEDGLNWNY